MNNVLEKIVENKKEKIKIYKKVYSNNKIDENIKKIKNFIDFKNLIHKRTLEKKISIIAEIKKASPSAGIILDNFNELDIAKTYVENGASFLSVLTEEDYFYGKLESIKAIKNFHDIPVLCKDFFIDTFQVGLAKSFGADCILIILSAVDIELAKDLYQAANEHKISSLIEVHSQKEAEIALNFKDAIIGINNRDLKTLKISLKTSIDLAKILHSHKYPLISESGIHTSEDIKHLLKSAKISNFLIGESLLKSKDIGLKLKEFTQISL